MVISVVVFSAFVIAIIVALRREPRVIGNVDKFPPISDADFLALCPPGTNPVVALKVRRIVASQLAVEYDRIHPSSRFIEDLGAD